MRKNSGGSPKYRKGIDHKKEVELERRVEEWCRAMNWNISVKQDLAFKLNKRSSKRSLKKILTFSKGI